jgi:hypothetical protein
MFFQATQFFVWQYWHPPSPYLSAPDFFSGDDLNKECFEPGCIPFRNGIRQEIEEIKSGLVAACDEQFSGKIARNSEMTSREFDSCDF